MTGVFKWPRFAMACSDGKIFLYARSPVAPKNTSASEWGLLIMGSSALRLVARALLEMSTELVAHRREQLVGEVGLAARAETRVQGGRQDGNGHGLVDRGLDRPAPLSGVRHAPSELRERGIGEQGGRRQVQEPRGDDAATPPHLGDVGQVQ